MDSTQKTVIVTGASQGIGAAVAASFLQRGYNVVATSRKVSATTRMERSPRLALVDGDIASTDTADRVCESALRRFGAIDALVNNAGVFISKSFVDYTMEDFRALTATNVEGFLHLTQRVVRQMLAQQRGGSIVNVTASIADHPIAGLPASVPMLTKGGLNAITRSLALELAYADIRVNAVAPGVVRTPLLDGVSDDVMRSLSPLGKIASASDVADAVLYLTEAGQVSGEVLRVDGGSHVGKW